MSSEQTQDVATLPAGRELDALVAEKVFGWEWREHDDATAYRVRARWGLYRPSPVLPEGRLVALRNDDGTLTTLYAGLPHYSTAIAAAWEVRTNLRADGWLLHLHEEGGKSQQWVAVFETDPSGDGYADTGEHLAPTPALAICRAALAAVEAAHA